MVGKARFGPPSGWVQTGSPSKQALGVMGYCPARGSCELSCHLIYKWGLFQAHLCLCPK